MLMLTPMGHFFVFFILNRIPLMKKLKWRLVATGNMLIGDVSQSTLDVQVNRDEQGAPLIGDGSVQDLFRTLDSSRPYAEVGLGVENIFKLFRVDYIRRLNYNDINTDRKSSIKFSFNLSL